MANDTYASEDLVQEILTGAQLRESDIRAQRRRVAVLTERLRAIPDVPGARDLLSVVDNLERALTGTPGTVRPGLQASGKPTPVAFQDLA